MNMTHEFEVTTQPVGSGLGVVKGNTDGWTSVYISAVNCSIRSGRRKFSVEEMWAVFCLQTKNQVIQ